MSLQTPETIATPDYPDGVAPQAAGQPIPALDIIDLHKRFGTLEVLKGISLAAHDGDVISVIGSSGSGKSTMLRCVNLLETPDRGEIHVNGE